MKSNSIKTNLILLALFIIPFSASTQYEHEVNQTNSQTDTESVSDIDSIYFDLSTSEMHIRLMNGSLVSYPWTDLVNMTFSGNAIGLVSSIDCNNINVTGQIIEDEPVSGINLEISYNGGNGGSFGAQTLNSTGVTGLTATLTPGSFNSGAGTLFYEISGTPNGSGTAFFQIDIGGQSCTVEVIVDELPGEIDNLDCAGANVTGTLVENTAASGVSFNVDYTGGNGGAHNGQSVASTGVTGLTANLPSGNFNSGTGTLTYEITGTPNSDGTAEFLLDIGGESCTVEITVDELVGEIDVLECSNAVITGTLEEATLANNVSFEVPYTGGNGGPHNGQTVNSTGVTGLTATLTAGSFNTGAGTLTYEVTGTPNAAGTALFLLDIGGETCTVEVTVSVAGCPTLSIGDSFGGGIVIDDDYPGAPCGYLIVRENNDDNNFVYTIGAGTCLDGITITGPNPPNLAGVGDGETNSNWLIQNCNDTPVDVCEGSTHGGFTDWFLPSKDEVELRFNNWTGNNYPPSGNSEQFFTSSFLETNFTLNTGGGTFNNFVRLAEPGIVSSGIVISNSLERPVRCVRSF